MVPVLIEIPMAPLGFPMLEIPMLEKLAPSPLANPPPLDLMLAAPKPVCLVMLTSGAKRWPGRFSASGTSGRLCHSRCAALHARASIVGADTAPLSAGR